MLEEGIYQALSGLRDSIVDLGICKVSLRKIKILGRVRSVPEGVVEESASSVTG